MIIRLIIYLILIYFAVKLLRGILRPLQMKNKDSADETEEMIKDPECGIYIPKKDALDKKIKGERYSFCSDECYKKYKEKVRQS